NATKQYSGSAQFEYSPPSDTLDIPFVEFDGAVKVQYDYDLYEDDSLEVRGTVTYRLKGQCSRCLRETAQDIEGELDAYFLPKPTQDDYFYEGGKVDLSEAIRDAITASLPFSLYCGNDDCQMISYDPEK
ncbi:MAG: DUF177 domain-containing protein, partial [Clostridia bacterium]|nr:DUF177 domain-containing protein [Clostridia bacterium]